jgi:acetyltransferase-like isoleucine patch superfamily enzyme
VFQKVVLKTLRPEAKIAIGNDVGISGSTISAAGKITIGNNLLIGSGVMIIDSDMHPVSAKECHINDRTVARPVTIEDDVFIGARVIILKGAHIGRGATVGAGSVVSCNVAPFTVVGGNPVQVIGRKRCDR